MGELTLQLVEDAVASRTAASALHPIRDELFPRLEHAQTIEDAEKVIHGAGLSLAWLGDALIADKADAERVRSALERAAPRMLMIQDELERVIEAAAGAVAARKALVAQETLRRFVTVCAQAPRHAPVESGAMPPTMRSPLEYLQGVALRLALLVVAVEHLATCGSALVARLADKAFETSQTLRRAMREAGIDLTPWTDAPAAIRARRILEAAQGFWRSLDDEQRRAVDEAWGERVVLPLRWPQPPS